MAKSSFIAQIITNSALLNRQIQNILIKAKLVKDKIDDEDVLPQNISQALLQMSERLVITSLRKGGS